MSGKEKSSEQRAQKAIEEFKRKTIIMGLDRYRPVMKRLGDATQAFRDKDYNKTLLLVEDPGVFLEQCQRAQSESRRKRR